MFSACRRVLPSINAFGRLCIKCVAINPSLSSLAKKRGMAPITTYSFLSNAVCSLGHIYDLSAVQDSNHIDWPWIESLLIFILMWMLRQARRFCRDANNLLGTQMTQPLNRDGSGIHQHRCEQHVRLWKRVINNTPSSSSESQSPQPGIYQKAHLGKKETGTHNIPKQKILRRIHSRVA